MFGNLHNGVSQYFLFHPPRDMMDAMELGGFGGRGGEVGDGRC